MMMQLATGSFDEESSTVDEDTPFASEPLLSPPGGAESLFLAGLMTSKLSAAAVSEQVKNTGSTRKRLPSLDSRSILSGKSDDFLSCVENPSDLDDLDQITDDFSPFKSLTIPESEEAEQQKQQQQPNNRIETFFKDIMATFYSNSKYNSTPTTTAAPTKMPPKPAPTSTVKAPSTSVAATAAPSTSSGPDLSKTDAAEVVYSKAKDVWAWGKTVPVVSFLVGTTETVASKALDAAGTNFSTVDGTVSRELAKLDSGILNPAIEAIVKAIMSAAGHAEEYLKPIILSILSTVGMIKSESNEANPEAHTTTPEITTKK
jgi:hypothetical protein